MPEKQKYEIRSYNIANLRVETVDSRPVIQGVAVVFNSLSVNLGDFREIILPGALDNTLADGHEIKALIDHSTGQVIGSRRAETLKLWLEDDGLHFSITLPNTTFANDLVENLRLGNINQCSFGFLPVKSTVRSDELGPIVEVSELVLYEVSVVAFPAYEATEVTVRSVKDFLAQQEETRNQTPLLNRARRMLDLIEAEDLKVLSVRQVPIAKIAQDYGIPPEKLQN